MTLSVASLHLYPIKSIGGFAIDEARIADRGFEHDRRWMLVDEHGRFISQREAPTMACLHTTPLPDGFRVTDVRDGESLDLPWGISAGDRSFAAVWSDTVELILADERLSSWFSDRLGIPCTLAHMPDATERAVDRTYAEGITSLSDGFPYLIISQASLDDLNERGGAWAHEHMGTWAHVPMNRFRPNIVVAGGTAFQEDGWKDVRMGDAVFSLVKPCARCPITTVDQRTGVRGKEPLRTLATFRSFNNKVLFGMNAVAIHGASVRCNDPVRS